MYTHTPPKTALASNLRSLAPLASLLACCLPAAGQILEFQSSRFQDASGDSRASWTSTDGTATLTSTHTNSASGSGRYSQPVKTGDGVSFAPGISPLEFPDGDEAALGYAFITAKIKTAPQPLATLVSASNPLRIDAKDPGVFSEQFMGKTNTVSVNGGAAGLAPKAGYQLIEVGFTEPVERRGWFLGNSAAFPERGFESGIANLILFPEAPTEREANAVRQILKIKYGVSVPTHSDPDTISILIRLGIKHDGLLSTVIMVR